MGAHEDAVAGQVVGSVNLVGTSAVGDLAVEQDLGSFRIFRVELAGALDEPMVALEDVGGGGDVGGDGEGIAPVAVDDEGEADGDAPIVQGAGKGEDGAPAEGLSEEDEVRPGGFGGRKCAVLVEIESLFDEFVGEFEAVVLDGFDVDAGEFLAFEDDGVAADAARRVVPAFPATDDAEDEGFAGFEGQGGGEVGERLAAGVRRQRRGEKGEQREGV